MASDTSPDQTPVAAPAEAAPGAAAEAAPAPAPDGGGNGGGMPSGSPGTDLTPGAQPVLAPGAQPVLAPGAQPVLAPGAQPVLALGEPTAEPVTEPATVAPRRRRPSTRAGDPPGAEPGSGAGSAPGTSPADGADRAGDAPAGDPAQPAAGEPPVKPRRARRSRAAVADAPSAAESGTGSGVGAPAPGDAPEKPARAKRGKAKPAATSTVVAGDDPPSSEVGGTGHRERADERTDHSTDQGTDTSTAKGKGAKKPKKKSRTKAAADAAPVEPVDEAEASDAVEVIDVAEAIDVAGASDAADEDVDADGRDPVLSGEPTEPAAATPAAPSFGLFFQAPEPTTARRRRATAPVQAPSERPSTDETDESGTGPDGDGSGPVTDLAIDAADVADDPQAGRDGEATEGDEESQGTTRRRRRGGRGRRGGRATGEDTQGQPEGSAPPDPAAGSAAGPDPGDPDSDEAADVEASGSRRRRRRRRSGSSAEGDDPPGTVTRVRAPRKDRDEPTAVKGSTRLEAKKQRRREGREAGRRRTIITEAEFLARRESVERVMVVRGHGDRTQIGVLEDGVLVEHYVSRETTTSMAGNVYLGRVQNVLPSMEAAFVDIGKGRNAVLYAGEVNWDAAGLEVNQAKRIENALSSGDTVLVQVTKDPIGHKGARLTSQISLPGRYLVYVPEGSMTGISRKLPDTERSRLKAILKEIVPDSAGVIVRTAAEGASEAELRADVERLTKQWERISTKATSAASRKSSQGGAPLLVHGEPDLTVRVIRDIFTEDFASLVVSGERAWSEVSDYVEDVAPDLAPRLQRWTADKDVFSHHRIDEQIAKAMDRKVWLPSGGSLVIDRTEAMTVIDVNTGKFVGSGGNLEETVTKNNIEAAEEIVRQLRLRDIGGIIVIDFIDMVLESNRELVVRRLLECLGRDRTKHQVAEVTSLGLVQMTRKRVGSGLIEVFSEACEHCAGRGIIVQSEPVDRSSGESGAGSGGAGSGSGGSGRRGGRRASGQACAEEPVRTPSGPTPAQIAAAAHAAAVKSMGAQDAPTDVVTELDGDVTGLDGDVTGPTRESEDAPATGASRVEDDELEPAVEPEPLAPVEPVEPVEPVGPVEPPRRRRRGRVVAPAGPPRAVEASDDSGEGGPEGD